MEITQKFYTNIQIAYNYFNKELFQSELPQVMITLNRGNKIAGYFASQVFTRLSNPTAFISEIALNPDCLGKEPIKETLSTLVHEMAHLWTEDVQGHKARKGFHSKHWGNKMLEIGLQPIDVKTRENKISGANGRITHKIIDGDLFDTVCDKLLETVGVQFDIISVPVAKEEKKEREKKRFKYYCENDCEDAEFTGKRDLEVICGECGGKFVMKE